MIKNIICLNMVKRNNKLTLEIVKDVNNHIAYDFIQLTNGFGVHKSNELMRSLNTGLEIKFENFKQYHELFKEINEIISKTIH